MIHMKKKSEGAYLIVVTTPQEEKVFEALYHGWEEFFRYMYKDESRGRPRYEFDRLKDAGFFQEDQGCSQDPEK